MPTSRGIFSPRACLPSFSEQAWKLWGVQKEKLVAWNEGGSLQPDPRSPGFPVPPALPRSPANCPDCPVLASLASLEPASRRSPARGRRLPGVGAPPRPRAPAGRPAVPLRARASLLSRLPRRRASGPRPLPCCPAQPPSTPDPEVPSPPAPGLPALKAQAPFVWAPPPPPRGGGTAAHSPPRDPSRVSEARVPRAPAPVRCVFPRVSPEQAATVLGFRPRGRVGTPARAPASTQGGILQGALRPHPGVRRGRRSHPTGCEDARPAQRVGFLPVGVPCAPSSPHLSPNPSPHRARSPSLPTTVPLPPAGAEFNN